MKILALDASGIVASVAIASEEEIIAEYTIKHKKTHSQTLLPMIDKVLKFAEVDLKDIEYIAATEGPGSFTGLRIGAATAKGLSQALNIPIVNVPTLEALAYNIVELDKLICPIMDARRGNVFAAIYKMSNEGLEVIRKQEALPIEDLIKDINALEKNIIFVGDGIYVHKDYIKNYLRADYIFAPAYLREQKAASVVGVALDYIKKNKYVQSKDFKPVYLRKSQAERELELKSSM